MAWASGMLLTSARLNVMPRVIAKLESNSAQPIPPNVDTPIAFTIVPLDLVGGWNAVTPTRFMPLVAGWYTFGGGVSFEGTAGTHVQTLLRKNGTTNVGGSHATTSGDVANPSAPIKVSAEFMNGNGDYIELMGRHNAAASINTATTLARRPLLVVTYAGPAD